MEHLVGQYPLCSMRFMFPGSNIRVLFAYLDEKVYILSAFYERAGHKNTGYSKYTIRQSLKSDWKNLWKENENVSQSNIIRSH